MCIRDSYVAIRLEALVELVDTLGPIQVYVPQEITYTDKNGNVTSHLDQGLQWMDGATAEFFLRARKTYAQSDIQRLNVQRSFYSAMFARLRAMTVWDVAKILPVVMNYMETSLDVQELVSAAAVSSTHLVGNDHVITFGRGALDRIEEDSRRVGALPCLDQGYLGAVGPQLQLLTGRGAEGIPRRQHDLFAQVLV